MLVVNRACYTPERLRAIAAAIEDRATRGLPPDLPADIAYLAAHALRMAARLPDERDILRMLCDDPRLCKNMKDCGRCSPAAHRVAALYRYATGD